MKWNNTRIIKKIAVATLNKSNNFEVALNSLGQGEWDKKNVEYFVVANRLTLSPYSGGYNLILDDIGVTTPIYRAKAMVTAKGDNTIRQHLYSKNDRHIEIALNKNTFLIRWQMKGTAPDGNETDVHFYINGEKVFYSAEPASYYSKIWVMPKGRPNTVSMSIGGAISDRYEYLNSIEEVILKESHNLEGELTVIFIEKGEIDDK